MCNPTEIIGGTTIVIDSIFEDDVGSVVGQDVAGGAIWTIGVGTKTIIRIRSVFKQEKCSNGGNPGNGGNGGAISFDVRGKNNLVCGTRFVGNQANKFGGAFFPVSYNINKTNDFHNDLI